MKTARLIGRICPPAFAAALALFLQSPAALGATTPAQQLASKLAGGSILNSPAPNLLSAVGDSVKENPQHAGDIVSAALTAGRTDTDAIAPRVSVAAITALGKDPSQAVVGTIISVTVKAAPAVVLETVRSSVKAAPGCAKTIVRAAVQAVPNPKDKIPAIAEAPESPKGLTKDDGFSKDDSKEGPAPIATEDIPQVLPIAEAIAQAAWQGDPSLSYQELLITANQAVNGQPGGQFTTTGLYYPPIISTRKAKVPAALPGTPVVSP